MMRYLSARAVLAIALVSIPCAAPAQDGAAGLPVPSQTLRANEKLITLDTRPGVTVRLLTTAPTGEAKGVFLLYPGGSGLLVNRKGRFYGAFRREFAELGYTTAVVDIPSDHPRGLGEGGSSDERFRVGREHVQDASMLVEFVKKTWPGPIYLFGHSMGAISVAHLASSLNEPRIRAVILASSPTRRGPGGTWVSVPDAALNRIGIPALLVHHVDDGCRGSTFEGAAQYPTLLTSSPRVGFVEVHGGRPPESSNPCAGSNYHSFFGIRREMSQGIVRWINGETVSRIDP